jgi:transposase
MVAAVDRGPAGDQRRRALEAAGLIHARPEAVTAPLFEGRLPFFSPLDKVQVKYEMLRAHIVDGVSVSLAASTHGYSRGAFYLVTHSFEAGGMRGLLDEPRGRRGPLKLTAELLDHLHRAEPGRSGADIAREIEQLFGVRLHRRTVERARRR